MCPWCMCHRWRGCLRAAALVVTKLSSRRVAAHRRHCAKANGRGGGCACRCRCCPCAAVVQASRAGVLVLRQLCQLLRVRDCRCMPLPPASLANRARIERVECRRGAGCSVSRATTFNRAARSPTSSCCWMCTCRSACRLDCRVYRRAVLPVPIQASLCVLAAVLRRSASASERWSERIATGRERFTLTSSRAGRRLGRGCFCEHMDRAHFTSS